MQYLEVAYTHLEAKSVHLSLDMRIFPSQNYPYTHTMFREEGNAQLLSQILDRAIKDLKYYNF